jgi:hypothetical protein
MYNRLNTYAKNAYMILMITLESLFLNHEIIAAANAKGSKKFVSEFKVFSKDTLTLSSSSLLVLIVGLLVVVSFMTDILLVYLYIMCLKK